MKYYKIIQDNTFIGAINSNSFMRYQDINDIFIGADEATGDLVECNNKLYRDMWMKPINSKIKNSYTIVNIIEITKEQYITFIEAMQKNQEIEIEDDIPIPTPITPNYKDEISLEFIRSSKINEMSYACRMAIESGIDLEIHGEIKHFSLTTQDQLNLMSLGTMAQTQSLIPYHADGEECEFYTSEEINQIIEAANSFKVNHTTYYNALKTYINALETIEEIAAITYGVQIPDEYKSDVLKVLEQ